MTNFDTLRLARRAPLAALLLLGAPQAGLAESAGSAASLDITVTGIKSAKGVIRLALCPPQAGFPNCKNRIVRNAVLPIANGSAHISLSGLAPGSYALSVFHDANGNGKLDTFIGIPREGYGFSRNPAFKPRAPKFAEAEITVTGSASAVISLRYVL